MMKNPDKMGLLSAISIGIGGMVGGGIFAVLGLSVELARGGTAIAFAVAGIVALITSYSYAKLSIAYPSKGGTVNFLNRGFGVGYFTGSMNILLLISYVVMLSLYLSAFGSYGASFFAKEHQGFWRHIFISGGIVLFTLLNIAKASIIAKSEDWIVGVKITILLVFIGAGLWSVKLSSLHPSTWSPPVQLIAGGMIIFVAYEGFELIANTAGDITKPSTNLPRAFFISVAFVLILYIVIAIVTVGNLPLKEIISARDYALAKAAKPFLGSFGFILIAVAALLSTGSAINATLYGSTRISYVLAKDGELPDDLDKNVWSRPIGGLIIVSFITLVVANLFDLSSISIMGSSGFLIIFALVNLINFLKYKETNCNRFISGLGFIVCVIAVFALIWETTRKDPGDMIVLVVMVGLAFLIEFLYRFVKKWRDVKV